MLYCNMHIYKQHFSWHLDLLVNLVFLLCHTALPIANPISEMKGYSHVANLLTGQYT